MALWKKITCGILAALVLIAGVAAVVLRDEISAVISGLRYSSEEIEQKLEENAQTIKDVSQIVPDFTIRDLTKEEKQGLQDGTLTKEELIQNIVQPNQPEVGQAQPEGPRSGAEGQAPTQSQPDKPGEQTPGQPQSPGAQTPNQSQPETGQPQVSNVQKQLAALIAEAYILRDEFLGRLDNLMAQAKAEYLSIPASERKAKITTLAGKYFSKAYGLEAECDARMGDIISRMETLLKENGGDLSIAQTVYDAYLSEKSLKKSWYLAELRKRGIGL